MKTTNQKILRALGITRNNVERNIRTVIFRAWKVNRPLLSQLAGFPLEAPPAVSHFIEMLANHLIDGAA